MSEKIIPVAVVERAASIRAERENIPLETARGQIEKVLADLDYEIDRSVAGVEEPLADTVSIRPFNPLKDEE